MQQFVRRKECGVNPFVHFPDWFGCLLAARGVDTPEKARAFLQPSMDQLQDPAALPGALQAMAVLKELRSQQAVVAIYGDYDVDGVCASSILEEALIRFGLRTFVYIPDRHEEGYGLNLQAVERLSAHCQALVTVDCGITSVAEVERARELGMKVIITDHHHIGDVLPNADALVSPLLADYPFPYLCGAGVAWKLCQLLCGDAFALGRLDLCALATVADVVALQGENRVLVKKGLEVMGENRRTGLRALCRAAGVDPRKIRSESVAYQLAPRLNAAGRLESAMDAYRLLRTEDEQEAAALSLKLETLNAKRREAQMLVLAEAENQVQHMDLTRQRAIVVLGENWDSGVVGLSAGKLAEKYAYPVVVLTRETGSDTCVGSARSACGVDLYQALKDCGDVFLRFGGHSQAAGMTLKCEHVPLLRERLSQQVQRQLQGRALIQQVEYDGVMHLEDVTRDTVEKMALLEPFGMGNPAPQFLFDQVEGVMLRPVGRENAHLKCTFRQDDAMRDGIFFGGGSWKDAPRGKLQFVGVPVINEFQGRLTAECQVRAMKLLPQTLPEDEDRELRAVLQELRHLTENIIEFAPLRRFSAAQTVPEDWGSASQGTLFLCRRLQTAKVWLEKLPHAHFMTGNSSDPRAYTAVGYAMQHWSPRYRHIVLCDGLLCDEELDALKNQYPDAAFCVLAPDGTQALLRKLYIGRDELRNMFRVLRTHSGQDAVSISESMGIPCARVLCAMEILCQMHLAAWRQDHMGVDMLPVRKCEPEESALYRFLQLHASVT